MFNLHEYLYLMLGSLLVITWYTPNHTCFEFPRATWLSMRTSVQYTFIRFTPMLVPIFTFYCRCTSSGPRKGSTTLRVYQADICNHQTFTYMEHIGTDCV